MPPIGLRFQMRQKSGDGLLDVALKAQTETAAATQVVGPDVNLNDGLPPGIPVGIREVRSEHQKHVASFQGAVSGGETDQARHADIVGVVVLNELLTSQGVNDRCPDGLCELHQFIVGTRAPGPGKDGHLLGAIE